MGDELYTRSDDASDLGLHSLAKTSEQEYNVEKHVDSTFIQRRYGESTFFQRCDTS